MKYVLNISDFYKLYESDNKSNDKPDNKKIKNFFKKHWKLLLTLTGLTVGGLTIYFLNRNKINIKKNDLKNTNISSNTQINITDDYIDDYFDKTSKSFIKIPIDVKEDIKKEIKSIENQSTKRVIISILNDIENPNLIKQVEELENNDIGEILNKSKDRQNFIENIATAIEQNIISFGDVHPHWKNDIQDEIRKRQPLLTHDIMEMRKKLLADNGIIFKDLSIADQKLLQTPFEQGFINKFNSLIEKKSKFDKAGITIKQIKGFDSPQRIKYLKDLGFSEQDLTKQQLQTFKTCSVDDFVDYVESFKRNYPKMKEEEWQKKMVILKRKNIDITDLDEKTVAFLKSVNMETFGDYIKTIQVNLDKSIDDVDIRDF